MWLITTRTTATTEIFYPTQVNNYRSACSILCLSFLEDLKWLIEWGNKIFLGEVFCCGETCKSSTIPYFLQLLFFSFSFFFFLLISGSQLIIFIVLKMLIVGDKLELISNYLTAQLEDRGGEIFGDVVEVSFLYGRVLLQCLAFYLL